MHISLGSLGWLVARVVGVALATACAAQAAPYSISSNGKLVYDHATDLIWMRCSIGQTWDAHTCVGKPEAYLLHDSIAAKDEFNKAGGDAGYADWSIPTLDQLAALRYCSTGASAETVNSIDIWFKQQPWWSATMIPKKCNPNSKAPAIHASFPNTATESAGKYNAYYWSSSYSYYNKRPTHAAVVLFTDGELNGVSYSEPSSLFVPPRLFMRLVRRSWRLDERAPSDEEQRQFWFADKERLAAQVDAIRRANIEISWKPSSVVEQSRVTFGLRSGGTTENKIVELIALMAQQKLSQRQQSLPAVRAEPTLRVPTLTKGEFESTPQFEQRVKAATDAAQASWTQEKQARAQEQRLFEQAVVDARAYAESPKNRQAAVLEAAREVLPPLLGNPVLSEIRYDADKQVFNGTLKASAGGFSSAIAAPAALADAPVLKQNLLSGKIAPLVQFHTGDMVSSWTLQENPEKRANRFAEARSSVEALLALIAEYPASPEAKSARVRVFEMPTTSKDLVNLINRFPGWKEAQDAAGRIPVLQRAEYNAAVSRNSADGYQHFLDAFAGTDTLKLIPRAQKEKALAFEREQRDSKIAAARWESERPQRERRELATKMCTAQVNTCLASCPRFIASNGARTDFPESSCANQCKSVRCD